MIDILITKPTDRLEWPGDFNSHVIHANALEAMRQMPSDVVQTCVTSPPYWGLRNYGTVHQVWDAADGCDHDWQPFLQSAANGIIHDKGMTGITISGSSATRKPKLSAFCSKCPAWRGEHGLEPTPELYVQHAVQIFRELRRILRPDGTLWLNLGDCYASGKGTCHNPGGGANSLGKARKDAGVIPLDRGSVVLLRQSGLKPKDLVGIAWMVAFALRSDGWYLRQSIIWDKKNSTPESTPDRCTNSHEYIFLLTKSGRYYFDSDAIREPYEAGSIERTMDIRHQAHQPGRKQTGLRHTIGINPLGRRRRSVWSVPTTSLKTAHFATFPEKLVEPCILAGSRPDDLVFDPYSGSGTTCFVAKRLGRRWSAVDLKLAYCKLSARRLSQVDIFAHN